MKTEKLNCSQLAAELRRCYMVARNSFAPLTMERITQDTVADAIDVLVEERDSAQRASRNWRDCYDLASADRNLLKGENDRLRTLIKEARYFTRPATTLTASIDAALKARK